MINVSASKNSKSGVRGVFWHNSWGKWIAYIMKDYKQIHLGCFKDLDDAIMCRMSAEQQLFGEFAYSLSAGNISPTEV